MILEKSFLFFLICRVIVNIQKISADVWVVELQPKVPFC